MCACAQLGQREKETSVMFVGNNSRQRHHQRNLLGLVSSSTHAHSLHGHASVIFKILSWHLLEQLAHWPSNCLTVHSDGDGTPSFNFVARVTFTYIFTHSRYSILKFLHSLSLSVVQKKPHPSTFEESVLRESESVHGCSWLTQRSAAPTNSATLDGATTTRPKDLSGRQQ